MGKLQGAVGVCAARRLLWTGVVQVRQLQLARHGDELTRLEVQQSHRAQRGVGEEVEEPGQVQTDLWADGRNSFNSYTLGLNPAPSWSNTQDSGGTNLLATT